MVKESEGLFVADEVYIESRVMCIVKVIGMRPRLAFECMKSVCCGLGRESVASWGV